MGHLPVGGRTLGGEPGALRRGQLMIQGADDRCDEPSGSANQERFFTGGYRRVVLDGVGHFPHREAPDEVLRYVVHKGSITVDGISLTVAAVSDDGFSVAVIPHTLAVTTLGARAAGSRVNLEVDLIAKYVERLLVSDRSPR